MKTVLGAVVVLLLVQQAEPPCYYVSVRRGSDENPGDSPDRAWQTLGKAVGRIPGGSVVIVDDGIYLVEGALTLGPSGKGPQQKTTFKAAPGARPILTGPAGKSPRVVLRGDFIRVEGLWFGGAWAGEKTDVQKMDFQAALAGNGNEIGVSGGGRVDTGRDIVGCTFFGCNSVRVGLLDDSFWQDNRFVRCGLGNDPPMLYFSGHHGSTGYGQHAIVDRNLFLVGKGYAVNGWHSFHNFIVTRNVFARVTGGFIADGKPSVSRQDPIEGSDHLIAHNLFWGCQEYNGATLIASNTHVLNNLFAYCRCPIGVDPDAKTGWKSLENFSVQNNAFLGNGFAGFATSFGFDVKGYLLLDGKRQVLDLGVPRELVDKAIDDLNRSFSKSVEEIHADKTIEDNFARIKGMRIPEGSRLFRAVPSWFDKKMVNIGPDAEGPLLPGDFWAAFHLRGLRSWGRAGERLPPVPAPALSKERSPSPADVARKQREAARKRPPKD